MPKSKESEQVLYEEPLNGLISAVKREARFRKHRGVKGDILSDVDDEEIFRAVAMIEADPKSVLAIKDEDGRIVGFTLTEENRT